MAEGSPPLAPYGRKQPAVETFGKGRATIERTELRSCRHLVGFAGNYAESPQGLCIRQRCAGRGGGGSQPPVQECVKRGVLLYSKPKRQNREKTHGECIDDAWYDRATKHLFANLFLNDGDS